MLRFCLAFILFFYSASFLKADDRGFVFTPSFSSLIGTVDKKISMKTAVNAELTYLMFNQLEFGVGIGFHRQHLTQKKDRAFYVNDEKLNFNIPRAKANSFPYYAVLRYNFDLFEDGYLVAAIKYGAYFFTPGDRRDKGSLPSYKTSEEEPPSLRYRNEFSNIQFFAATIGYDISNTIISLEYRVVSFNQDLYYFNDTASNSAKNSYSKSNHYLGINMAYKIDLF